MKTEVSKHKSTSRQVQTSIYITVALTAQLPRICSCVRVEQCEPYLGSPILGSALRLRQLSLGLAPVCIWIFGIKWSGRIWRHGDRAGMLGGRLSTAWHHICRGNVARTPQCRVDRQFRVENRSSCGWGCRVAETMRQRLSNRRDRCRLRPWDQLWM